MLEQTIAQQFAEVGARRFLPHELQLSDELLGEGDMAVVRAARLHGEPVAAKVIRREKLTGERAEGRVRRLAQPFRLAQHAALQTHQNLALPLGYECSDELVILYPRFMVNLVDYAAMVKSELSAREAAQNIMKVILGVAGGMTAMHQAGFVHRDVKTLNVVVNYDDRLKSTREALIDFDLTGWDMVHGGAQTATQDLIKAGGIMGSIYYCHPLIWNDPDKILGDGRYQGDFYGLGMIIAYNILGIEISDDAISKTIFREYGLFRRRGRVQEMCDELGLPGLDRVVIRLTEPVSLRRNYQRGRDIVTDLALIMAGNGQRLRTLHHPRNKRSWWYRKGQLRGNALTALAASPFVLATGALGLGIQQASVILPTAVDELARYELSEPFRADAGALKRALTQDFLRMASQLAAERVERPFHIGHREENNDVISTSGNNQGAGQYLTDLSQAVLAAREFAATDDSWQEQYHEALRYYADVAQHLRFDFSSDGEELSEYRLGRFRGLLTLKSLEKEVRDLENVEGAGLYWSLRRPILATRLLMDGWLNQETMTFDRPDTRQAGSSTVHSLSMLYLMMFAAEVPLYYSPEELFAEDASQRVFEVLPECQVEYSTEHLSESKGQFLPEFEDIPRSSDLESIVQPKAWTVSDFFHALLLVNRNAIQALADEEQVAVQATISANGTKRSYLSGERAEVIRSGLAYAASRTLATYWALRQEGTPHQSYYQALQQEGALDELDALAQELYLMDIELIRNTKLFHETTTKKHLLVATDLLIESGQVPKADLDWLRPLRWSVLHDYWSLDHYPLRPGLLSGGLDQPFIGPGFVADWKGYWSGGWEPLALLGREK